MPHILIVYKQFPAPHVGHAGGESLYYLMQGLRQRGWTVSLVARIKDDETPHLEELQSLCSNIVTTPHHTSLPGFRPFAWIQSYIALRRIARDALRTQKPDCVHVETTQTALALVGLHLPPSSMRTQDVNWYLAEQQSQHQSGLRKLLTKLMQVILRWVEPPLYNRYDVLLAISKGDLGLLQQALPERMLHLVPLRPLAVQRSEPVVTSPYTVIFVGAMSRDHNINAVRWFVDDIWPDIVQRVPEAKFYIVGGNPTDAIRNLGDAKNVFVTGYVDDLHAWYASAAVFVSPMLVAGGLLQKIVDAMSLGVPVVCTSVCNHGIGAVPDRQIVIADQAEVFADAVVKLLLSPDYAQHIRDQAMAYIQKEYDFDRAIESWDRELHIHVTEQE